MRRHWIVVAAGGAGLAALLLLTAVGSRQEGWRGDGGSLRDVPSSVIDSAYTLLVLAAIAGLLAAALVIRRYRPRFQVKRAGSWQSVIFIVTFALLASYLLVTTEVGHRLAELLGNAGRAGQQGDGSKLPQHPGGSGHDPQFQWWLAVPIVAATVAGYVWYRRRNRPRTRERRELAEELEAVLTETLEDLELESDPRRAVIRAYARMERALGAHGLPRKPSETPLEYLARVLAELNVRAEAAHALTELFERRELAEELEAVLTETLEDLELESDPRRAVIRAYARMERALGAHGLPRKPSETPLEYLARVLAELNVRAEAAHALTELFERARFSQHEIDLAMKDEAIVALETVRDDLQAAA